jgi:hypothetical protein
VVRVELDVAPAHDLAMGDVVLQLEAMREANRQGTCLLVRRTPTRLDPDEEALNWIVASVGPRLTG